MEVLMKLLVKAYGKKNIAELTPKLVLVTGTKRKPFWMKTYVRTEKIEKPTFAKEGSFSEDLLMAAKKQDIDGVRTALKQGANVNAIDKYGGMTPLINSISYKDDPYITKMLLDSGADPNLKDFNGWTPLMHAGYNNKKNTAKLLLEYGADPNIQDDFGVTALMHVSEKGNTDIAKLLLKHGAKLNLPNNGGATALMYAVTYNKPDMVKLLLEHGADVSIKDKEGDTALSIARKKGYYDIIDLLLSHK
jgi:ankyrin repeat protein